MSLVQYFNIAKIVLSNFTQHNGVLQANAGVLDLVLSTKDETVFVLKHPLPLKNEDVHHPCLSSKLELS